MDILKTCEKAAYFKSVSIIKSNLEKLESRELLNIFRLLIINEENDEFIFLDKVINKNFFFNRITEWLDKNNLKLTIKSKNYWIVHSKKILRI